jgi:hypothetical protein
MRLAHLSDDRLVELYFTETPSAQEQQHLGACGACDQRRSRIAHLLDETSQAGVEDLEQAFPAERFARQQVQILERIEAAGGPARVIAFPATATYPAAGSRTRWTSRWVAAAAVAGLLVGVAAGRVGRFPAAPPPFAPVAAVQPEPGPGIRTVTAPLSSDDQFLVELESAIESRGGALYALDALTPRAWDR